MKRMTTDNPQLNIERLLNTARAENNQAVLHLGDEVITLAEYVAKCAKEYGCDVTPESVMDGDNCVECGCPVAILNILGIQAAENNARLKMIEKILGNVYDLDRLKELIEAEREGRIKILPKSIENTCGTCENFLRIEGTKRGHCKLKPLVNSRYGIRYNIPFEPSQSRKACKNYESALEAMKESENDG